MAVAMLASLNLAPAQQVMLKVKCNVVLVALNMNVLLYSKPLQAHAFGLFPTLP